MNTVIPNRSRRGFTLLMLLLVLSMLGVGALLATRLFQVALRTTVATQDAHTRALRFDNMLNQLRRDVWSAGGIKAVDAQTLDLQHAGSAVRWQLHADATVTRDAKGEPLHRWPLGKVALRFEPKPAGLSMHVREDKAGSEQSIALVSQLLLAGGSR